MRSFSIGQTEPEKNNQQAIYTLFSANDDAICISYATISMAGPGGPGNSYGMMGDFGKQCGATWFCKFASHMCLTIISECAPSLCTPMG